MLNSDETSAEAEKVERARQAKELLANPLLQTALDAIEKDVVGLWAECPARDMEGKEALWQLYKTSQKFRGLLNGYIETGKLANDKLKRFDKTLTENLKNRLKLA